MKRIGFLGCGKIGGFMLQEILKDGEAQAAFIQDPFYRGDGSVPVTGSADETLLETADLVIESATAGVLKENLDVILKHCDLMVFSVTAFSDRNFYEHATELAERYQRRIYLPHGAILGVDGIADGRELIRSVTIETVKNPASLGRFDRERTVVYEGSCRGACAAYPRNVNVHATVALAGIGFDKTVSRIVSDPTVSTNTHFIHIEGEGIRFDLDISSFADGGVTGKYTPYSAVGSLRRILGERRGFHFV